MTHFKMNWCYFYSNALHYQCIIVTVRNLSKIINAFRHRLTGLLSLLLPTIILFLKRHLKMQKQGR